MHLEQQADHVCPACLSSDMQRRHGALRPGIHCRSSVQEQLRQLHIPLRAHPGVSQPLDAQGRDVGVVPNRALGEAPRAAERSRAVTPSPSWPATSAPFSSSSLAPSR